MYICTYIHSCIYAYVFGQMGIVSSKKPQGRIRNEPGSCSTRCGRALHVSMALKWEPQKGVQP